MQKAEKGCHIRPLAISDKTIQRDQHRTGLIHTPGRETHEWGLMPNTKVAKYTTTSVGFNIEIPNTSALTLVFSIST
jgi:hypothetical protein